MPERQSVKIVKSTAVQGEGSYVRIAPLKFGESRAIREQVKGESAEEQAAAGLRLMVDHILSWNWVDDDGQPLPQPKDNPAVIDLLTVPEIQFLTQHIAGSDDPNAISA